MDQASSRASDEIRLWKSPSGRLHLRQGCSGNGGKGYPAEYSAIELQHIWQTHQLNGTDPCRDLCRCMWGLIPRDTPGSTPPQRLILKAARQWTEDAKDTRPIGQRTALIRLRLYSEVASDVLEIAQTPFAFEMAIRDALKLHPVPYGGARNRDAAIAERTAWEQVFTAAVLEKLS